MEARDQLELLDRRRILACLPGEARAHLHELVVLGEIDSTNRYLMDRARQGASEVWACMAERQTEGRGRRGRAWVSPFGGNLYLSVLKRFAASPEHLQGLSLAMGVAVAGALESVGVEGVELKWPNDLLLGGSKLAGVLLEMISEPRGPSRVVIGIGINVRMPEAARAHIDQPWADLASAGVDPGRNRLAAVVLAEILRALKRFDTSGFEPFRAEWQTRDAMGDRPVVLESADSRIHGYVRGVDPTGALLLEVDGDVRRVLAGDISLRSPS
jgi:BirA family biotin operon repressor/biotin-[acetyl-CoA-carboxylase] ligase